MSESQTPKLSGRNECREWTCPLHGAENMRLDKAFLNAATGPAPEALAELERLFSVPVETSKETPK